MPTRRLPDQPDVEQLRNQAKALQRRVRESDPQALELLREFHPRHRDVRPETVKRADAQLVVARSCGFVSWPALRATLDVIGRFARSPHQQRPAGAADEFLVLACLTYGGDDPRRWARARQMLDERPELAGHSIYTAAAVGDAAAARRILDADPGAADRQGGPHKWEPLLYLAYSRIDSTAAGHSTVEVARLLLERGADPAAGFLWDGLTSPFTVLAGVFGGGEGGQPAHRDGPALAELLLEAGADANDSQTLYNRGLHQDDDSHLPVLLRHGLGRGDGGVWHRRLGPTHPTPAQLLQDELIKAAQHGAVERARLLVRHGADPRGLGTRHPVFQGLDAFSTAVLYGNADVAELFGGDGDPVLRFLGACMRGDAAATGDRRTAELAIAAKPHHLVAAAKLGRTGAVRLMAELGFEFRGTLALHEAAYHGHLDTVRALVELGADPGRTDPSFHATARGWAEHNEQWVVADYLASVERSRTE
ncbi:ankyrin repeat domain-containing protein [Dactylosporangium maewongense]|uniref:Ankyrin repeat domain-containing protein n=1 Tax=Dactylosporangium maewongense TaxID=634393 RepID=A0ABP4P6J8_9ACTN